MQPDRSRFLYAAMLSSSAILHGSGHEQKPLTVTPPAQVSVCSTQLTETRKVIATHNVGIREAILEGDQKVILEALPELEVLYGKMGYSRRDICAAVMWTWEALRTGPEPISLSTPIPRSMFQKNAASQGRLLVYSDPDGALIYVDNWRWRHPTNADGFAHAGERHVRVVKEGYAPAEANCKVEVERVTKFDARLRKKGSTATCK